MTVRRWTQTGKDRRPAQLATKSEIKMSAFLLETFSVQEVEPAIIDALHLGTISFDAVKHLLLCRIERRPPRLDLENYPHLPLAEVQTTQAADYMALLLPQPGTSAEVTR
jgi:hypothetical protein